MFITHEKNLIIQKEKVWGYPCGGRMTDFNEFNVTNRGDERIRRHYKRRKHRSITPMMFFFFCLLAIGTTVVLKHSFNIDTKISGGDKNSEGNIFDILAKGGKKAYDNLVSSDDVRELEKKNYPQSLVKLYKRNKEAREFVLHYEDHMNLDTDEEGYVDNQKSMDISKEVEEAKDGKIPLFLQWDERWGYSKYGDDFMANTGCGPTTLSMVYVGLTGKKKYNPYRIAKKTVKEGYYVDGAGSSWNMMTDIASEIGLYVRGVSADKESIIGYLSNNNPIICIMGPGDFTSSGHFIVLTGIDEDGNVYVNDPNSIENSEKTWSIDDIIPQMKSLWAYSIEGDFMYEEQF